MKFKLTSEQEQEKQRFINAFEAWYNFDKDFGDEEWRCTFSSWREESKAQANVDQAWEIRTAADKVILEMQLHPLWKWNDPVGVLAIRFQRILKIAHVTAEMTMFDYLRDHCSKIMDDYEQTSNALAKRLKIKKLRKFPI